MSLAWWEGLLLGTVQGVSEFLPISSSGHLVLVEAMLGYQSPGVFFEVGLHVATLLSVVIVYRGRIGRVLAGMARAERESWAFAGLIVLATLPAAVVGLTLRDAVERAFDSLAVVGVDFLVTAAILWSSRWVPPARTGMGPLTAFLVGCAQAVAILPGVSRSGATIVAALWRGVEPRAAAEFSFLMAVVVIAGTGVLEVRHMPGGVHLGDPGFLWAFAAALVSGVLAIRLLVRLLRHGRFHSFAPYVAALGVLTLAWAGWAG